MNVVIGPSDSSSEAHFEGVNLTYDMIGLKDSDNSLIRWGTPSLEICKMHFDLTVNSLNDDCHLHAVMA